MYIVIVGATELGRFLARLLIEENHDVVIIDKDQQKCEKAASELEIVCSAGDATDSKMLENAGAKECDALVALTSHDETNMVISLLAKELGTKTVATRLGRIEYDEKVLKKLGIDIVIHPEAAAAGYIAELITKPEVLDLAFISRGDAEIMEVAVKEKSKIAGKKVKDIEQPSGSAIVAIIQREDLSIPKEETIILPGQKLLILTKREAAEQVRKLLG